MTQLSKANFIKGKCIGSGEYNSDVVEGIQFIVQV